MFTPKTERIKKLSKLFPAVINELEHHFAESANVYIDWQNVVHWQDKLGWHIHVKRLKQFLYSFDTIKSTNIYAGTLEGNKQSEDQIVEIRNTGYHLTTKPVKLMRLSIDVSSVPKDSTAIIRNFVKKSLLAKLDIETIEYLNARLSVLNKQGIRYIEEPKCNFDVEIGRDMQRDFESTQVKSYILWSTDSDFADLIQQVRNNGGSAVLFAVSGKVAPELDKTGVFVFDIRKIREFICWPREIPQDIQSKLGP